MNKKTKIINLFGGPGAGKSTAAAYLFYKLKEQGKSAELVREYVKSWVWEQRKMQTYDQLYFLGKQIRHESLLYGKVDYIITDAPVLMNTFYAEKYSPKHLSKGVKEATLSFYEQCKLDGFTHTHILLDREHPYDFEGRFQAEEEALELDKDLENMLVNLEFDFTKCKANKPHLLSILLNIL